MKIEGYKAFNKDLTNRYGRPFEEGKDYHVDGPISFGNHGNGFHMCKHLSDVFRFFEPDDVTVAHVIGSGECVEGEYDDWSEPYYDMYSVSDLHVGSILSRAEIIDTMMSASASDIIKFMATYRPTEEEALEILRCKRTRFDQERVLAAFLYYYRKINVYVMEPEEKQQEYKKVLIYGQNSNKGSKGK